jgi:hypothetical protein
LSPDYTDLHGLLKKEAHELHEGKKVEVKVEVENFLPKVFKKCPKGNYHLYLWGPGCG